ncbi:uncharacterized protein PG986_001247 [Apiospora aurea]|uniref:Uncharacterized protein n=1 Tax=Apiospora aurea TaxID=335848 RepID=A0ABR1QWB8_9PEZI
MPMPLDEFLKVAGDLEKGLEQWIKDGEAALPTNLSLPSDPGDPFWKKIQKSVEASGERFKAIVDDIGIYIPPEILAYTDKDSAEMNALDQRHDDLQGRLGDAKDKLDAMLTKANQSYEHLTSASTEDLRAAVHAFTAIAEAIRGNFDKDILDSTKRLELIRKLRESTSRAADSSKTAAESAERTWEETLTDFCNNTILGAPHGLSQAVGSFKLDVDSWVKKTNDTIAAQQKILDVYQESLKTQQETLQHTEKRYTDAVSEADCEKAGLTPSPDHGLQEIAAWILCWPVGIALHLSVSKDLIEDVANAQRLVDQTRRQALQSEKDVRRVQVQLLKLQKLQGRGDSLTTALHALREDVNKVADAASLRCDAARALMTKALGVWAHVQSTEDRAEDARPARTKAQYATPVLLALAEAQFVVSEGVRAAGRGRAGGAAGGG